MALFGQDGNKNQPGKSFVAFGRRLQTGQHCKPGLEGLEAPVNAPQVTQVSIDLP